jgi:hypothetical protein
VSVFPLYSGDLSLSLLSKTTRSIHVLYSSPIRQGEMENLKCSVLYLHSKAASAMAVKPSVAHFAMERMVCGLQKWCHRSHNGIIPLLGLMHPGICPITKAKATLLHLRIDFLTGYGTSKLSGRVRSSFAWF